MMFNQFLLFTKHLLFQLVTIHFLGWPLMTDLTGSVSPVTPGPGSFPPTHLTTTQPTHLANYTYFDTSLSVFMC